MLLQVLLVVAKLGMRQYSLELPPQAPISIDVRRRNTGGCRAIHGKRLLELPKLCNKTNEAPASVDIGC
jgi:hypothetical protein